ncbi:MAG: hypothetical protein IJ685_13635 [Selenomonadaceae bacterium]|nr:hypothetical protein [Selenomonadaceae bacterium]
MNFFVTGDDSFKMNIDLEYVTPKGSHGANFAADKQSLTQSLSIAREVFSRVERGKIDFVLIGLAPDCLFQGGDVDKNLTALSEYLKLCIDCGAKPVCVIFSVAPSVRESYRKKFVEPVRDILAELKKIYAFEFVDLFDFLVPEDAFKNERTYNLISAQAMDVILTFKLYELKIFPFAEFRFMSYEYISRLSYVMNKKLLPHLNYTAAKHPFHAFMDKIFQMTIDELKRKDKIKIAFVTDHAAAWCGDKLYYMFANNPRFETTIFLCLSTESTFGDALHDVEQFKARGLNVVSIFDLNEETPQQDIVIFLRPYLITFSKNFQTETMTPQTLWTYIHYGSETATVSGYHDSQMFRLSWKSFFDSEFTRKFFDTNSTIGMPRAYASGLPKMDSFFEAQENFSFRWKMTRPDAKKIIWAPHWSFEKDQPLQFSTFNRNYKFMYEFAKNHPETSWVVKPHPRLLFSAFTSGLFPSVEAFEEYLQAWNDLPNAQVFTGGYYQEIFATSDGMIQDSCSFIAEYQFTHKPMIYLTRKDTTGFTELGEKILNASYCVDGSDLEGIAALMQKIFIEGDDPLKDERQKVFDELLNYRRVNGVSASEYIFHSIADELTGDD